MSNSIKGVEIFKVGTHNKLKFEEKDLDAMVTAFNALGLASRVPLKFGHNASQPITDGQPSIGWVQRIWRAGEKVLADFVDVPTEVMNVINKGLYKFVSVELLPNYKQNGTSFSWVLDAVALLGADRPAVRGLKDLQALTMASKVAGATFSTPVTFTLAHESTTNRGSSTMTPEEESQLRADLAAAKARADKLEADIEADKKRQFTEKVTEHRKVVTGMLEAAVTEGRIAPRVRDREVNSRLFKSDDEVLTAYTVDSVKAIISENQLATFKEKKAPTSLATKETDVDLSGKRNDEALHFKVQEECLRVGGKIDNYDDMLAAQTRVLRNDPALAKAYFAEQDQPFKTGDAA